MKIFETCSNIAIDESEHIFTCWDNDWKYRI